MDDAPTRVNEELPIHRFITQAQKRIDRGEFRRGLASLEHALWELSTESTTDGHDSLRALAVRVAEQTGGRSAKKARRIIDQTDRRRAALQIVEQHKTWPADALEASSGGGDRGA